VMIVHMRHRRLADGFLHIKIGNRVVRHLWHEGAPFCVSFDFIIHQMRKKHKSKGS
jgi:hypothetical protein